VEPENLTIKILQEIRDDNRSLRTDMNAGFARMDKRFEAVDQRFEVMDQRFLVVETALRDFAEQLVMLSRGMKAAIEVRANVERRLDEYEKRLQAIEDRESH
jgi:hypothetical protein